MPNPTEIVRILADEYGITSEKALNEAIAKLGFINVAPFCTLPKKVKEEKAS